MWDIGGCRCIVDNDKSVYKLLELLKNDNDLVIKKNNDYVESPQESGYRSLHLYIACIGSKDVVEVQLRNLNDHNWATLVEITDVLFKTRIKEYGRENHPELFQLHLYLSKKNSLINREKKELVNTILKYNYYFKLCEVFTRNNIPVRKQWLESSSKGGNYFLISTNADGKTALQSFPNFFMAEEVYFETYKKSKDINMVLTHLPRPNYDHISMAYSNYILTYHAFLDDFYSILQSLVVEAIRDRGYFKFSKYYNSYNDIVFNHMINLLHEVKALSDSAKPVKKANKLKFKGRELEWYNHINSQIAKRQKTASEFSKEIIKILPDSYFMNWIYMWTIDRINSKFKMQFQKTSDKILKGSEL